MSATADDRLANAAARAASDFFTYPFGASMKPYSEACDNNQAPILAILQQVFASARKVLEIGSGTGQHAVYFARHLPHLIWQPSDLPEHHAGIQMWLAEAALPNVLAPITLNVNDTTWLAEPVDAVFTANTLHIISWPEVQHLIQGVGRVLLPGGVFCVYGPFNYGGTYTAPSNARFDDWLKNRDPKSGIRDAEAVIAWAAQQGLDLEADHEMPVNNRTLVFRKD